MATITEDYVSFEVAKLLKEKGFNEPVTELNRLLFKEGEKPVLGITHQKAMKWLREVHGVYIEIPIVGMEWESPTKWYYGWRCQTKDVIDRPRSKDADYPTYEQAVEAALKYSLENLI